MNTEKSYNWGYDPWQYFVPEGGFSLSPNDPYSRIIETKKMISALHKAGIKVNMDVVFNHVYNYEFSSFESIVPNYYFRKNKNGTLCNGSGCGDDLDTSRKMVRKLIIDAIKFWVNEYGIDGYRFDLKQIPEYEEADLVYTTCSSPSFKSEGEESILTFNKTAEKETILVKTGYYYINGKEYYLFPSKDQITLDEEKFIEMENPEISGDEITLVKATNNYIRNSEMLFKGINELYNYDATKSELKGVSVINSLTACDNFNN